MPIYTKKIDENVTVSAKTSFMLAELEKMFYNDGHEDHPDTGCVFDDE